MTIKKGAMKKKKSFRFTKLKRRNKLKQIFLIVYPQHLVAQVVGW